MLNAFLHNIEAGKLPRTKAKTLSFVTQVSTSEPSTE